MAEITSTFMEHKLEEVHILLEQEDFMVLSINVHDIQFLKHTRLHLTLRAIHSDLTLSHSQAHSLIQMMASMTVTQAPNMIVQRMILPSSKAGMGSQGL